MFKAHLSPIIAARVSKQVNKKKCREHFRVQEENNHLENVVNLPISKFTNFFNSLHEYVNILTFQINVIKYLLRIRISV